MEKDVSLMTETVSLFEAFWEDQESKEKRNAFRTKLVECFVDDKSKLIESMLALYSDDRPKYLLFNGHAQWLACHQMAQVNALGECMATQILIPISIDADKQVIKTQFSGLACERVGQSLLDFYGIQDGMALFGEFVFTKSQMDLSISERYFIMPKMINAEFENFSEIELEDGCNVLYLYMVIFEKISPSMQSSKISRDFTDISKSKAWRDEAKTWISSVLKSSGLDSKEIDIGNPQTLSAALVNHDAYLKTMTVKTLIQEGFIVLYETTGLNYDHAVVKINDAEDSSEITIQIFEDNLCKIALTYGDRCMPSGVDGIQYYDGLYLQEIVKEMGFKNVILNTGNAPEADLKSLTSDTFLKLV